MVNQQYGGNVSGQVALYASGNYDLLRTGASAGDDGSHASMFARGDARAGMISLTRDADLAFLKKLGFDKLDIAALAEASPEERAAVAKYVVDHAYNFGKENNDTLSSIKSEKLQNLAAKITSNSSYGLSNRRILSESIGVNERIAHKALGTSAENPDIMGQAYATVAGAMTNVVSGATMDQIKGMLSDLGFSADGATDRNIADILMKGETSTQEGKRISKQLNAFAKKSLSEQTNILRNVLSKEQFNKYFNQDGSEGITAGNQQEINDANRAMALALAQTSDPGRAAAAKMNQADNVKSAIDSAVDTRGHGFPYVRIKDVDAEMNRAIEDRYRKSAGIKEADLDTKSFWDFFKSTKNT